VNSKREGSLLSPDALYQPFALGRLKLRNRIVMAPMTRRFSPEGIPTSGVAKYYRRRVQGGVSLVFTEGTWVPHTGASNDSNVPRLYGEDALQGWKLVVDAVHDAGGFIMPQLWHVGLFAPDYLRVPSAGYASDRQLQVGPSGIAGTIGSFLPDRVRPMSSDDISAVIEAFAHSAECAYKLGFDGVALHGGHGYLIDQFLWEGTNLRTDEYGGSIGARARFAADIVKECKRRTSSSFPVVLRISQWKLHDYGAKLAHTPAELATLLEPLVEAGVDVFDCSQREYWKPEFEGSDLNFAGWTKKLTGRPSITVGSVGLTTEFMASLGGAKSSVDNIDRLIKMLERGDFDLVAVGRMLISDPDWPNKIRDGKEESIAPFLRASLSSLE
jgi:2,4-dienoyl-CoA reductase-like NADH-dependent reductase (Old Yellow Enzyme family)